MSTALKIDPFNAGMLRGRLLRMWHYSPSHDRLAYQIDASGGVASEYLIFLGCSKIKSSVVLRLLEPEITPIGTDSQRLTDGDALDIEYIECMIRSSYEITD
jgi:hypothetical protein